MPNRIWLLKSEPDVYSIDDLQRAGRGVWEGVRNYQARNYLREMAEGELFFFYHSNATPPGIAGLGRIARPAYPDPFQHDPKSDYFDPKSPTDNPRWSAIDVAFLEKFDEVLPLELLKMEPALEGLLVTQKGTRLSVTPVDPAHARRILAMAGAKTAI